MCNILSFNLHCSRDLKFNILKLGNIIWITHTNIGTIGGPFFTCDFQSIRLSDESTEQNLEDIVHIYCGFISSLEKNLMAEPGIESRTIW